MLVTYSFLRLALSFDFVSSVKLWLVHLISFSYYVVTTIRFFLFKKKKLIYFWLQWIFLAACGLSQVVVNRAYSLRECSGFLTAVASLVVEHGL